LNVLLIFIPLSLYLEYLRPQAHTLIFFSACLGIIPLAGWMGRRSAEPRGRRIP
jgi:Ca2+:H+ antiporter